MARRSEKSRKRKDYVPLSEDDIKYSLEIPIRQIEEGDLVKIEKQGNKKKKSKKGKKSKKKKKTKKKKSKKKSKPKSQKKKGDYILVITEKPQAAKKIANALGNAKQRGEGQVKYYELKRDGKKIMVGCAVGHLFTLDSEKKGWPVFDIEWVPSYKKNKWTKKYYSVLEKLAKRASDFIVATDYDVEGEVIGWNIVRFIANQKDAKRMKFSTLTKSELEKSYDNLEKNINWGQAIAGETRHFLDWMYGVNLSKALMSSIKKAGKFKIMSIGRVQGPALNIIVKKEKKIQKFKPKTYWHVFVKLKGHKLWLKYNKRIKTKKQLKKFDKFKGKEGASKTRKKEKILPPPYPFDLTSLQRETHKLLGLSPSRTLQIAQKLYLAGIISYPRTSSQKIPKEIEPKKILKKLSKKFKETKFVSRKKPVEGKKTDPAHPSIYPTGNFKSLKGKQKKVYDLIVKRFISCFCPNSKIENKRITFEIKDKKKYKFKAKGKEVIEKGWLNVYPAKIKNKQIEDIEGKKKINKVKNEEKETKPPRRYTAASLITQLEKKNLGTKCLTPDTPIKINTNNQIQKKEIGQIFNELSSKQKRKIDNIEIATNNNHHCFSFNGENEKKSLFKSVSKRKIQENENLYKIRYKDGSEIKLTGNHPLLIFNKNQCQYIRARDVKGGMKSVASMKKAEKEGGLVCSWKRFLKKCDRKTPLYGVSNQIYDKRKNKNISQKKFGKKYGLDQPMIHKYEKNKNAPFWLFKKAKLSKPKKIFSHNKKLCIKNPFPIKISSPLSRILANLVGDCSIDKEKIKKENCYDFKYHNTNINLIKRFSKDLEKVFNFKPAIKKAKPKEGHLPKYYLGIPAVIGRIISILFKEVINKNASKIPSKFYPEFIGALFDDEGDTIKNEPKIFISNINFNLLKDVKKMLADLKINSIIDKNQYKLYIRGRKNLCAFLEKIPIASAEKKQRLVNILTRFYKYGTEKSSLKKQFEILNLLGKSEGKRLTNREISKKLDSNIAKTRHHLNLLQNNGFIEKEIEGISKRPRKKTYYKLIKPLQKTFFKYLGEKIINSNFITKTIDSIKKIDYDGFVYDITNTKEHPNFILNNGVVVHNSTRSNILDKLYKRKYIKGRSIKATPLGMSLIDTLSKYSPVIIDEKLTRSFEKETDNIKKAKKKNDNLSKLEDKTLKKVEKTIKKISKDIKKKQEKIGKELIKATKESYKQQRKENMIRKCPSCKKGKLLITYNKKSKRYFVGCTNYPKCRQTYTLPRGLIKTTDQKCKYCGWPKLIRIKKGKRPWVFCFNPDCESNREWQKRKKAYKKKMEKKNKGSKKSSKSKKKKKN